jgi:hypothetical protein
MIAIIAMVATLILSVGVASANEPAGATVSYEAMRAPLPVPDADPVTVQAGNITVANLDTEMSTLRWAGVFGNTTGSIILGDSDNNRLYEWTAEGNLVYFANAAVDWTALADANQAAVEAEFGWVAGTLSDNYLATFNNTVPEDIGSNIFTLSSDFAETISTGGTAWKTYSLTDGSAFVFAGLVDPLNEAYDGTPADFQVILPNNGTDTNGGAGAPETWDVYLELV